VTYHIDVERAGKRNAVSLVVDGKPLEGNILPIPPAGKTNVNVKVTLS
jgi:cellobiose phosphorylase